MASPQKKQMVMQRTGIRKAIADAIESKSTSVLVDSRPCSLEITRGRNNELSWNIKLYSVDGAAVLDSVKVAKTIEDEIRRQFKQ